MVRWLIQIAQWLFAILGEDTLRRLVQRVFVRTQRELLVATHHVADAQQERLLKNLARNAGTVFGQSRNFSGISSVDEYREQVPIQSWDEVAPWVDRMVAGEDNVLVDENVFFYATTSGTTGRRKLIPVTSAFVEECRVATKVLFRSTLLEMPRAFAGKRLSMRSPNIETLAPGIEAGSITLALSGGLSGAESQLDAVPSAVYRVSDFSSRYRLCLRFAAQEHVTLASAVNPSTLLLFAQTLETHWQSLADALEAGELGEGLVLTPDEERILRPLARKSVTAAERVRTSVSAHGTPRMIDVWPDLAGLVCWKGGSAPWYLGQLPKSYGQIPVLDYGYVASEGCFGAPLSSEGADSLLLPHGHFFEFMDVDSVAEIRAGQRPTRLLHELESGKSYYVVVTTAAGLYRYDMNDIVEVQGFVDSAPLVVFRQKGGAMSSVTGEKLGEAHVVQAMARARQKLDLDFAGFACAPLLPREANEPPRYLLAVDPGAHALSPAEGDALACAFDLELQSCNEEYQSKRASLRLGNTEYAPLPAHALVNHRAARVRDGAPDAHVKVPHISPTGDLLLRLGLGDSAASHAARLLGAETTR